MIQHASRPLEGSAESRNIRNNDMAKVSLFFYGFPCFFVFFLRKLSAPKCCGSVQSVTDPSQVFHCFSNFHLNFLRFRVFFVFIFKICLKLKSADPSRGLEACQSISVYPLPFPLPDGIQIPEICTHPPTRGWGESVRPLLGVVFGPLGTTFYSLKYKNDTKK